jgi:hypothetical protein
MKELGGMVIRHGKGKMITSDGRILEGLWKGNRFVGSNNK